VGRRQQMVANNKSGDGLGWVLFGYRGAHRETKKCYMVTEREATCWAAAPMEATCRHFSARCHYPSKTFKDSSCLYSGP
jgi:hypothetical protein